LTTIYQTTNLDHALCFEAFKAIDMLSLPIWITHPLQQHLLLIMRLISSSISI